MAKRTNKNNILLLIYFMLQTTGSYAAVGYLTVRIEPGTYTVLDEQVVANQSFENMALSAGAYLLHVYNPGDRSWQDRGLRKEITIEEAETLTFDLRQKNGIRILSNPAEGLVFVDSILIGRTPLIILDPYLEGKRFTVMKEGYQNYSFLQEFAKAEYSLLLKPVKQPLVLATLQTDRNENRLEWLHEGLIITSLAGSWLSFLFKRKADSNYEKYLHSARPENIRKYYDRTVQFDHYAEISFAVSLLSLGGYFYMLLTE